MSQRLLHYPIPLAIGLACLVVVPVGAATAGSVAAQPQTGSARPHILLIIADDLGRADVGFNWPTEPDSTLMAPITPHIDALAQSGVILDRFYTAAMCGPTRTSLMTGRLPMHVNSLNTINVWSPVGSLPLEMTTLAEKLRAQGYSTHHCGKWHLGSATAAQLPISRGFTSSLGLLGGGADYLDSTRGYGATSRRYTDFWKDAAAVPPAEMEAYNKQYATDIYTDNVVSILKKHGDQTTAHSVNANGKADQPGDLSRPMFIHLAHQAPHSPYMAPKETILKYGAESADASACIESNTSQCCTAIRAKSDQVWLRQVYLAMVTSMDDGIGKVVETLKAESLYANTLIIFSSDNGGMIPNSTKAGPASNGALRGGKGSYYDGGVRVVAFASGGALPGKARGTRRDGLMHITDLYATFGNPALAGYDAADPRAAAAGLPPPDAIDMWPFLAGDAESPRLEVPLKGQTHNDGKQHQHVLIQTINGSVYKMLIKSASRSESVTEASSNVVNVFNLSADPSERVDLVKGSTVAALDGAPLPTSAPAPLPAPTEAHVQCKSFCYANLGTPWTTKCEWENCKTCPEIISACTAAPTPAPTPMMEAGTIQTGEHHDDVRIAAVWAAMLDRVRELMPTYYQAPISDELDSRCTDAAEHCYGGSYGPFLVNGPADDAVASAIEYPSRCLDLAWAAPNATSTAAGSSSAAVGVIAAVLAAPLFLAVVVFKKNRTPRYDHRDRDDEIFARLLGVRV